MFRSRVAVIGLTVDQVHAAGLRRHHDVRLVPTWSGVAELFTSGDVASVLAVGARAISPSAPHVMEGLARVGIRPRTVIFLPDTSRDTIRASWSLNVPDATLAFDLPELRSALTAACSRAGAAPVMSYIAARLNVRSRLAREILQAIADSALSGEPYVAAVVRRVRRNRSAVYAELSTERLPPLEQLGVLIRLIASIQLIQEGGSTVDASFVAKYSSSKGWRKALRERIGISVSDIRKGPSGWQWIVDRWLEHHDIHATTTCTGDAESLDWHEISAIRTLEPPPRTLEGRRERQRA